MTSVSHPTTRDATTFLSWFPPLAPQLMFGLICTLALLCVFGAYILATTQPSVGITWTATADTHGLVANIVSRTDMHFPIAHGDRFVAIKIPGGDPISLHSGHIIDDPDIYLSYADYNNFFSQQSLLADILQHPLIEFIDADGRSYTVSTLKKRPTSALPLAFWIYTIGGFVSFMVTLGVWCYRRSYPSARLFVLSGLGFFCAILCLSVYGTRELALDGSLFYVLTTANHFFMLVMTYSLLGLFWFFPQRLGSFLIIFWLYFSMLIFWLNETFQWYQVPLHPFYVLTFLAPYLLAVPLAILQWRKSYRKPDERAAFKWFLLAIIINMGIAIAVFVIPPINKVYLVLSLETSTLIVLVMYIGLAMGILRYRLFDLDRWWLTALTGFFWIVLFVVIDITILQLLSVHQSNVIAMLFFFTIVWLYFPIRQWLWARLVDPPGRHLEQYLPSLVESLFLESEKGDLVRSWHDFLKKIFQPLEVKVHGDAYFSTTIYQDGLVLRTRLPIGDNGVELIGKRHGTRLFGMQDVELIDAILVLANRFIRLQISHEETAAKERTRIERILHDDVGAKLRTLEYIVPLQEAKILARSAFDALSDVRNRLITQNNALLEECLGDWRAEINMRIDQRFELHWVQPTDLEGIWLTPVQTVNCRSILREAVTNIILHSHGTDIRIVIYIEEKKQKLIITIADNGNATDIASLFTRNGPGGHGLINMHKRAEEMQGTIKITKTDTVPGNEQKGLTVMLSIPLKT